MRNALPIAAVTLALAIVWYIAAVAMNASLQRDRFLNAGQKDYATSDLVGASLNMDRPKLPAPHQIVAELWRSIALTDPSSKRSLTFHAAITLRETLLGFAIGVAGGGLLAVLVIHAKLIDASLMPWVVASQMIPIIALAPMIVVIFNQFNVTGILPKAMIAA